MGTELRCETYTCKTPHYSVIIYLTESQTDTVPHKAFLDVWASHHNNLCALHYLHLAETSELFTNPLSYQ